MRLAWLVVCAATAAAQTVPPTAIPQTHMDASQDVVPSFDGWLHNQDGTFTFVFGYMNRNYKEEMAIPAGPDNKVEPGRSIDQGQPTYFLPRRHAWVFEVKVPADWPAQKELVWTITSHGRTEKAYASLVMEEEIIPRLIMSRGNLSPGLEDPNQPPTISMQSAVTSTKVGSAVDLMAVVTDDGLPKAPPPKPVAAPEPGKPPAQTNSASARPRLPLNVTWMQYRGPAKAVFSRYPVIVKDGKAPLTANFSQPGMYVLRASASDGQLNTTTDITITVSK
jgi:hypothetical protein